MDHEAKTLEEAIELGTLELRTFYGDMNLEVKVSVANNKVKIGTWDTDKPFYTIWQVETKKILVETEFLKVVDINNSSLVEYAGSLPYAYSEEFDNGLFMVFTQNKTDTLPYCQFAVNISEILKRGK